MDGMCLRLGLGVGVEMGVRAITGLFSVTCIALPFKRHLQALVLSWVVLTHDRVMVHCFYWLILTPKDEHQGQLALLPSNNQ
jgi:hypothetical protein